MTAYTANLNSGERPMQKIVTNLWFDGRVEEALELYTSCFEDAHVTKVTRYTEAGMGKAGDIMTAEFELAGQAFRNE